MDLSILATEWSQEAIMPYLTSRNRLDISLGKPSRFLTSIDLCCKLAGHGRFERP
jgi:hypothetical protein